MPVPLPVPVPGTSPSRALLLLAASFGLAWVAIAMVAAPGPAAFVALSGRTADAGLFFAIFSLSSAAGAAIVGRAMDRFGRKRPLVASHLLAAAGFALAGLGVRSRSLATFVAGTIVLAFGIGAVYLTRVAASELFGPAQRAQAVARVQVAATLAAVAGPFVVLALASRLDLLWFVAPPIYLVAALLVSFWRGGGPVPHAERATAADAPIERGPFALGFLALVCAQGAMVTIMGVTGVELAHAGHAPRTTSMVMSLHFLGMFGLSIFVGHIAQRVGRALTIFFGVSAIALGGLIVAFEPSAVGLAIGLLVVGVGWSFAYIGGTVLLTDVLPAARRARTIGLVDLATALLAALTSYAGGLWYARRGMMGLGLAAIAIVALPALAAIRLRIKSAQSV